MSYFSKFPQINYSFDNGKINKTAINILKRVGFKDFTKNNSRFFIEYNVMDGDTPEMVAHKIYGDSNLHWVILLFNDIINPYYDWPLSTRKLESYIKSKYPGKAFFLTDESGGTGTFPDVHFERNWTVLGVHGNTYDTLSSATHGFTNAALVHNWDKSLSKLEVTGVSGTFATGDFVVAIGTSADGSTYNVGGYIARLVDLNYEALYRFENPIDNTILNPFGTPPTGGTGEQNLISGSTGNFDGGATVGISYENCILQNYIVDSTDTYTKTNFQYETERNEKKRTIKLIRPEMVQKVLVEFEDLMQGK